MQVPHPLTFKRSHWRGRPHIHNIARGSCYDAYFQQLPSSESLCCVWALVAALLFCPCKIFGMERLWITHRRRPNQNTLPNATSFFVALLFISLNLFSKIIGHWCLSLVVSFFFFALWVMPKICPVNFFSYCSQAANSAKHAHPQRTAPRITAAQIVTLSST